MLRAIVIFSGSVKTYHRRCHIEIKKKKKEEKYKLADFPLGIFTPMSRPAENWPIAVMYR